MNKTDRARVEHRVVLHVAQDARPDAVRGGQTARAGLAQRVADGVLEVVLCTFVAGVRLRHVVAVDHFEAHVAQAR